MTMSDKNKIHLFDNKKKNYTIHINFPYNAGYSFDEVHLLEHLMIDGFLNHYEPQSVEEEIVLEALNGLTLGISLCFSMSIHYSLAPIGAQMMQSFLGHMYSFTQQQLDDELQILKIEAGYDTEQMMLTKKMDKYYPDLKMKKSITKNKIDDLYQEIVVGKKPIIIAQGDQTKSEILQANELLKSYAEQLKDQETLSLFSVVPPHYFPKVEKISLGMIQKIGLYVATPLNPEISGLTSILAINWLYVKFVNECLFEYLRHIEKTDYQPKWSYRIVPYGWQGGWEFFSKIDTENILHLLQEFFYKNEYEFEITKKKIYYDMLIWEDDSYMVFYVTLQELLVNKRNRTIEQLSKELLSISYKDFKDYHEKMLDRYSIELVKD